jgi:hypothetical protein
MDPVFLQNVPCKTIDTKKISKFICSRIKKKAEAESKNGHGKTMLSLEKPIRLI